MKPKGGDRSWESAASERQRRPRSASSQPKALTLGPLAGVAVLKVIGFALTWRETQEGVSITFRGLSSRLLDSYLTWKPRRDSESYTE